MPKRGTADVEDACPITNEVAKAIRLGRQRETLARKLEELVVSMPGVLCIDAHALSHLAGYRVLEKEGLAHAGIFQAGRFFVVLAAASRVIRRDDLRRRLFALRRLAEIENRRVVVATPRGLVNETARLRSRDRAGLVAAPRPLAPIEEDCAS